MDDVLNFGDVDLLFGLVVGDELPMQDGATESDVTSNKSYPSPFLVALGQILLFHNRTHAEALVRGGAAARCKSCHTSDMDDVRDANAIPRCECLGTRWLELLLFELAPTLLLVVGLSTTS